MQKFHTVIVGGGPGGLACADLLARHGREVLVLERRGGIGPKVCAGGIPCATLPPEIPPDLLEKTFFSQEIFSNWQRATMHDSRPMLCTVDRSRLGRWLAARARAAGAEIRTDAPVLAIGEKIVHSRNESFGYDFLVGADGSNSMVRRHLGLPTRHWGVGINFQVPGEFHHMEWHLNSDLFGPGYAWIFPHRHTASVGVYTGGKAGSTARLLEAFRLWAEARGVPLGSLPPRAARVNFDFRGWRFGNRFLVGDAAGLASGLTGEGICSAMVSGEEAARAILDAGHDTERIRHLLKNHRRHARILAMAASGRLRGKLILETLLLALRAGIIHHRELEMTPARPPLTRNPS